MLLSLVAILAAAACAREPDPPEAPDPAHWHAGRFRDTLRIDTALGHHELAILDLPEVVHGSADVDPVEPYGWRIFVNVQQDHSIRFRGMEWRWEGPTGAGTTESLRRELNELVRERPGSAPDEEGGARVLVFQGDRGARWEVVRRVLEVARAFAPRIPRMRIAADTWVREGIALGTHLTSDWVTSSSGDSKATAPALPVSLSLGPSDDARDATVRLSAGGSRWEFPPGTGWHWASEDSAATRSNLDAANRAWEAFEAVAAGATAGGTRAVALEIGDAVPWEYVVEVLDVCLGVRQEDVRFLGTDLALRLVPEPPLPQHAFVPGDPDPRDWSTALALGIGVVTAVLVFALGRLSLRARPRPRKSPAA